MASVNWSQKALDDVEAIAVYIARDSTIYASAIVQKEHRTTQKNTSKGDRSDLEE